MASKLTFSLLLIALLQVAFAPPPPTGSVTPCVDLGLRKTCNDLACTVGSYFRTSIPDVQEIPSNGNTGPFLTAPNPDATKVLSYTISGLGGTWDMNRQFSQLSLFVDGQAGVSISAQLTYDFNGDGTVDRTEIFKPFALDGTAGFQLWQVTANTDGLQSQTGASWMININNANVVLKLWSSQPSNSPIQVQTDRLSIVTIPYNAYWVQPATLDATCVSSGTVGGPANAVAFFLDGVQDFYLKAVVEAIFTAFQNANAPLTVAVPGNKIGTDAEMMRQLMQALRNPSWELACNGYNFEDFATLTYDQQNAALQNCKSSLETKLFYKVATFIPPNNSYNRNTYIAMANNNISVFVPPRQNENGPFAMQGASFYKLPWAAQSLSSPNANFMLTQIRTAVTADGFAVVGLHPQNFATGDQPNAAAINELSNLITQIKAQNWEITPIRAIPVDVAANENQRYHVPNCSCVAFRLDDIQNFAMKAQQKGIIDLFRSAQASLTVGIIGALFGLEDPDIVGYIQDQMAAQTNCWKFEVANHGYLHESFPTFALDEQVSRLQLTQEKVTSVLGVTPQTFMPPFNDFNNDTITAVHRLGFKYMSAQTSKETFPLDHSQVYRVPIGAATSNFTNAAYFQPVSSQLTWQQIKDQLDYMGFASVMIHPYEYGDWTGTAYSDQLNMNTLNDLRALIQLCKDNGLRFVTLGDVEKYFNPFEVYPCTGNPLETSSAVTTGMTHTQSTQTTQTQTQSSTQTQTHTQTQTQTQTTQTHSGTSGRTQTQTQTGSTTGRTQTQTPSTTGDAPITVTGDEIISFGTKLFNTNVLAFVFLAILGFYIL